MPDSEKTVSPYQDENGPDASIMSILSHLRWVRFSGFADVRLCVCMCVRVRACVCLCTCVHVSVLGGQQEEGREEEVNILILSL